VDHAKPMYFQKVAIVKKLAIHIKKCAISCTIWNKISKFYMEPQILNPKTLQNKPNENS
jgi:hypothetical protein